MAARHPQDHMFRTGADAHRYPSRLRHVSLCPILPGMESPDFATRLRTATTYRERIVAWRKILREERRKERVALSRRIAEEAAAMFSFHRIYLFGSTVGVGPVSVWSDIDLVVEGLPKEDFLRLLSFFAGRSPIEIDLKPMEGLDPDSRQRVRHTGMILHER